MSVFSGKRYAMAAENLLTMIEPTASGTIGFSTIFLLIMFVVLTMTAIHVYFKTRESYKLAIAIPGPPPIPILGNALLALGKTPTGKTSAANLFECKVLVFQILKNMFLFFDENHFNRNPGRVFAIGRNVWACS